MNHGIFPILFFRVPRYMEDGGIILRPLKISDGCLISNAFKNGDILRSGGMVEPMSKSWISLWWWLKKTYVLPYCIEAGSELIGFIGLYNLRLDRSAEISLAIFDKKNRRLGYGTRAFNLLTQNLKQYTPEIRARVKEDNGAAISFWSKLGFKGLGNLGDTKMMSVHMTGDRERLMDKPSLMVSTPPVFYRGAYRHISRTYLKIGFLFLSSFRA
jgi:RimJ/RimL family protein N-acetyltransferase